MDIKNTDIPVGRLFYATSYSTDGIIGSTGLPAFLLKLSKDESVKICDSPGTLNIDAFMEAGGSRYGKFTSDALTWHGYIPTDSIFVKPPVFVKPGDPDYGVPTVDTKKLRVGEPTCASIPETISKEPVATPKATLHASKEW